METRLQAVPVIRVSHKPVNRILVYLVVTALCCTLGFFCGLWLLNGYFTATTIRTGVYLLYGTPLSWEAAWLFHLSIWYVEHFLWILLDSLVDAPRLLVTCLQVLIMVTILIDVLTSALGILGWFYVSDYRFPEQISILLSTFLAVLIVIIPKPAIASLSDALWRTFKG